MKWLQVLFLLAFVAVTNLSLIVDPYDYIEDFSIPEVSTLPQVTVTTSPIVNNEEVYLLARLLQAEAMNEPDEGQIAVGNVVLNHMKYKNWSLRKEIFCRNRYGPRYDGIDSKWFHYPIQKKALKNARLVFAGVKTVPDGVMYFHNPCISTDTKHVKKVEKTPYAFIGDHYFCYHPDYYKPLLFNS